MLPRNPQPIYRRKSLRLHKRLIVKFIKDDAFLADIGEEVLSLLQIGVHLPPGMDDETHRCFDRLVADQPVGGLVPIVGEFAEPAVVDDNQQIEVGAIALHGERLVDPAALGIGAEQDDFQDPAALLELGRALFQGVLEFLVQDFQDPAELSLFARWYMIERRFHEQSIGERSGTVHWQFR
ncbi:Hypothetical protein NGAL_HAMBI1146_21430 [Neorhizobium galegae bv. officinalis]|nr:Hypothetical protein NGAL_HAMBI1146_21430 [Neorhizobium galegae bv. officinalis]